MVSRKSMRLLKIPLLIYYGCMCLYTSIHSLVCIHFFTMAGDKLAWTRQRKGIVAPDWLIPRLFNCDKCGNPFRQH